jgi:hypothetical protein
MFLDFATLPNSTERNTKFALYNKHVGCVGGRKGDRAKETKAIAKRRRSAKKTVQGGPGGAPDLPRIVRRGRGGADVNRSKKRSACS